jgi:hypothetical protein
MSAMPYSFFDVMASGAQLKHWRREKKERLAQRMNPTWKDLAQDWGQQYRPCASETQGGSTRLPDWT